MKNLLSILLTFVFSFSVVSASTNLWEYYGGNLPSVEERALIWEDLGYEGEYRGTGQQNEELLFALSEAEIEPKHFGSAGVVVRPGTVGVTVPSGTVGSVLFVDGSQNLGQDNTNFYWDDTNNILLLSSILGTGSSTINGDLNVTKNLSASSTLTVAGHAELDSTVSIDGTLTIGGDVSGTSLDRVFMGVCYLNEIEVIASSTSYAVCSGATGVTNGDNVVLTATSSLNADMSIQSASSTPVNGEISVLLFNHAYATDTVSTKIENTNGATASFTFWAFR